MIPLIANFARFAFARSAQRSLVGQAVGATAIAGTGAMIVAPEAIGNGVSKLALRSVLGAGRGLASTFNEAGEGIADHLGIDPKFGRYIGAGLGVAVTGLLSSALGANQNPLGTLSTLIAMAGVAYGIFSQGEKPAPEAPAPEPQI